MRFLTFGEKKHPAIVLIHGYGISWRMWLPQIEGFRHSYYVVVPVLDGHDEENDSDFFSVEKAAEAISDYIENMLESNIFAICGTSLGATIAVHMLAQNRINVEKAIIDGGPLVPMNKVMLSVAVKVRLMQNRRMRNGNRRMIKRMQNMFYSEEMAEEVFRTCARMSDMTCKNVLLSAFAYTLPPTIKNAQTKMTYWYGSKETFFLKKSAEAVSQMLPAAQVEVFQGFDHGELCIGHPELYIQKALAFFIGEVDVRKT
ncbi:Pimeloyl-ACP methyl ester carboxylesterase [Evansella caseinilytica]|uniref:Pimeloyl-ACP methyl ester carboxylesterase n=1 Tax=Evansella caseinilytica TaxID=1503961 RepID=A0A1H3H954_9BACI|nr:alpha/beta hydrolase [Evansella caseinilytica]SDY12022.1 Pimeloyl-ACP methyl ester carboxylesterase [Evansella caseinilytica]